MNWFVEGFRKYAAFGGRSRRKEFFFFMLFSLVITLVLVSIDRALGTLDSSSGFGLLSGVFSLAILVPSVAVSVRRLHDIDLAGWWFLVSLIPVFGAIALVILAALDGTAGDNRFGPDPKSSAPPA